MILESFISWKKQLLSIEEYHQIKATIKAIYENIALVKLIIAPILSLLIHDKKNEYGTVQFALLETMVNKN
jgi:3-dehydroquinate synthase